MTDSPSPDKRPALADLHDSALAEPREREADGARRFTAWFDGQAESRRDEPLTGAAAHAKISFEEESVAWWRRASARGLLLGACASAIAFAAGVALSRGLNRHSPQVALSANRALAPLPGPSRPVDGLAAGDPCREAVRAVGRDPLVDDFEDGNELVALLEARNGYWVIVTDSDRPTAEPVLLPAARPEGTAANRNALHLTGGRHTLWGISAQVELGPTCYDASAYRGIAFDVRGPGRLFAGVREVDIIPVERGGTCTTDCYDSHLHGVDATSGWTHHELAWSDLRQRGRTEPANPRRLNGLEFIVRPADTPCDLWIDNVAFVR